ncbi:MAG: BsuPI-related putative proteinase inhibitor [Chthoniobacterales bacterium]
MFAPLVAGPQKTNPISQEDIQQISRSGSSEESPFLIEREAAQQALATAAKSGMNNPFPAKHSFKKQIGNFFSHLAGTFKIGTKATPPSMQLLLEPSAFSVADTPELSITFKITNNKKEIMMLNFSTNQRIDILVKNVSGAVIMRWSEDRSFDPMPGLVAINPEESVIYTEKIPTTMMKDGNTYIIQVSLVDQEGYTLSQQVTPAVSFLESDLTSEE